MFPFSCNSGGWSGYKALKVVRKERESDCITSFYLEPPDGAPVLAFKPGQYLSFKLPSSACAEWPHDMVRNYSISCRPGQGFYRISVKKELGKSGESPAGIVSNYFHEELNVGDLVQVGLLLFTRCLIGFHQL